MASRHDSAGRRRARSSARHDYVFETLEPRILLSADPLSAAVGDALHGNELDERLPDELKASAAFGALSEAATAAPSAGDMGSDVATDLPLPVDLTGLALLHPDKDAPSATQHVPTHEFLFVDSEVAEHGQLVTELLGRDDGRDFQVVLLDRDSDGIDQISEALAGHQGIDAIHLISHGTEGGIQLGGTWLSEATLAMNAEEVAAWGGALTDAADILFYACDVAGTQEGKALVQSVGALTGADVAASVDLTGHASLGGNWDLEFATGVVESRAAFNAESVQGWKGTLATAEDDFESGDYTGGTG
ncbi:MAG: DUF4347 domain-containing protein, partial [Gammaproteobacteria bacterium]|nr:DUF4347 domain-containing protein [Gammaproteobacteria bacterium]